MSAFASRIARHAASMEASSASGCRDAAIDQRESPGATVIESGMWGVGGEGSSCGGAGVVKPAGSVCVGSCVARGLSAQVSETPGMVRSYGVASVAATGAPVTSAEPMSAPAPARASNVRESLVP